MRALVIRHYRTVNNEARRIMGWGDAPPAEDWEADLLHVDELLRKRNIRIDAFYSSGLGRARETAGYFARKRGPVAVSAAPELNEVNYGDLFERPKEWVTENYPEYKTDPDFVFPAGESFRQMQQRSVDFLLSLEARYPRHTLLVVAHAGVIRGLICHFLGLDFAPNLKRKISHRYIGDITIENGACTRYDELGKPSGFVRDDVVALPYPSLRVASRSARPQKALDASLSGETSQTIPLPALHA